MADRGLEGVLTTLRNGYRAIAATDITAYTDAQNRFTTIPIPAKSYDGPAGPWPWKKDVEIDSALSFQSTAPTAGFMDDPGLPNPEPEPPYTPTPSEPEEGTIAYAKGLIDGYLRTTLTVGAPCPDTITVMASTANPCEGPDVVATSALDVRCYWDDFETMLSIYFCIDATGSMGQEGVQANPATDLEDLLRDLMAAGYSLRLAGTKFNEAGGAQAEQTRSFTTFTSAQRFIDDFINDKFEAYGGGDYPELQLDALVTGATELAQHGAGQHIVILVTDSTYHYRGDPPGSEQSLYTKAETISALQAASAATYIGFYSMCNDCVTGPDPYCDEYAVYIGLDVGGAIECVNLGGPPPIYPFLSLRQDLGL